MNNAVILGVSRRENLWKYGRIKEKDYPNFVKNYALELSKIFDNLIVVPDDGVYTDIALEFGRIKGKKPIAYYPDKDKVFGIEHIRKNFEKYDAHPIGGDWYKLSAEIATKAELIICLGISPGVLIELSYLKFHQKNKDIKLFIDEDCIEHRLPKVFSDEVKNVNYYAGISELKVLLKR